MTYSVNEMFYSLQGEGGQTGRAAVFVRFAGCNLWSGLEKDRAEAECTFCDTSFADTCGDGGGCFNTAGKLAAAARALWPQGADNPLVVCTGGEPFLQLDEKLIAALHDAGFEVAAETNGTLKAPGGIDWLTVSPKAGSKLAVDSGDELKLVYPQPSAGPETYEGLDFKHFFLQPMDGPELERNTRLALNYCLEHPKWRLSLQTQKLLNIK